MTSRLAPVGGWIGCHELLDFDVRPRLSGDAPVVRLGHGQDRIALTPLDTANVNGVVGGNGIAFFGAWPGADYILEDGGHLVRKTVPLRLGHPRTFAFRIDEHSGFDPIALTIGSTLRILPPTLEPPAGSDKLAIPLSWLVTQQGGKWVLSVTLPPGDYAGWTVDPTLTLQPDAAAGLDTQLRSAFPDTNYGTSVGMYISCNAGGTTWYRILIQFDLTGIPSGSTITTATLSLYLADRDGTATYAMNRVLAAAAWTEAGATWNTRDGTNAWPGSAGCNTSGTDYSSTALRSGTLPGTLGEKSFSLDVPEFTLMWQSNYGLVYGISNVAAAYNYYYTSDYATAADRPKLVVDYTLPGGSSKMGLLQNGIIYGQGF